MAREYRENIYMGVAPVTHMNAVNINYNNAESGLTADNIQSVIDGLLNFPTDTNEHIIGKWSNGKPIYRKRFRTTTPATGSSVTIGNSIDNVISSYGNVKSAPIGHYASATAYSGLYMTLLYELKLYYPDIESYHNVPIDIIVDYTKSTD